MIYWIATAGTTAIRLQSNFNPEINLREVSANGSYWEDGHWVETEPMEIKRTYDFPQVGPKEMYLLHHEEIESLAVHVPGVKRIRFFMTFGESYLTHMKCLENVGMLSTSPIVFEGKGNCPHPVSESAASGSCHTRTAHKGKDEYWMYLYRREGWTGENHLYL